MVAGGRECDTGVPPVPVDEPFHHSKFLVRYSIFNPTPFLTTQCYVDGNGKNDMDRILNNTKNGESLIVPFQKIPDSATRELSARFNLVIGKTPEDRDADDGRRRRPRQR